MYGEDQISLQKSFKQYPCYADVGLQDQPSIFHRPSWGAPYISYQPSQQTFHAGTGVKLNFVKRGTIKHKLESMSKA